MPGGTFVGGAQVLRVLQPAACSRPATRLTEQPAVNTVPTATLVSESRVKLSRVVGWDSTDIAWSSDVDFSSYQLRVVSLTTDPVTSGVLIEQDQSPVGGGTAGTQYTSTITDAELEAVSPAEGAKVIKLFLQTVGGWSS